MDLNYLEQLIPELREYGIEFAPGLTDEEVERIEYKYGFRFPPDLRMFFQYALPVSDGCVNWREDDEATIRDRLEAPLEGIFSDIEVNNFWMGAWGEKPRRLSVAFRIAKKAIRESPKLIPIFYRYIPDEPHEAGNPVLSVMQTDIIYYGYDLADYFIWEFWRENKKGLPDFARPAWMAKSPRPIRFWEELVFGYAGVDYPEENAGY
jgi:hypothetical protein